MTFPCISPFYLALFPPGFLQCLQPYTTIAAAEQCKNQQLGTMYTLYSIHVYKAFPPLGSMISVGSILGAVPVMRNSLIEALQCSAT